MKAFRKLLPFVCAFALMLGTVPVAQAAGYREDTLTLGEYICTLWEDLESYAGDHEFTAEETEALSDGASATLGTLYCFDPFASAEALPEEPDAKELISCGLAYARQLLETAKGKGETLEEIDLKDMQTLSGIMESAAEQVTGKAPASPLAGSLYTGEDSASGKAGPVILVFCLGFAVGMVILYLIYRAKAARRGKEEAK